MAAKRPTTIEGDVLISGQLSVGGLNIPAAAVADDQVAAGAPGQYVNPTKIGQQYTERHSQPNAAATTETRVIHVVYGATATVASIQAGSIAINVGAATVTVDLKKNGTTIMTGVVTLNSGNTAYVPVSGTVASPNLLQGDVLSLTITATISGGTLATGVFVSVVINEDPV